MADYWLNDLFLIAEDLRARLSPRKREAYRFNAEKQAYAPSFTYRRYLYLDVKGRGIVV